MPDATVEIIGPPTKVVNLHAPTLARARDFYAIYCASSGGKSHDGKPCPPWDKLGVNVRRHWYVVALRSVQLHLSDADLSRLGEERDVLPNDMVLGHLGETEAEEAIRTWTEYWR